MQDVGRDQPVLKFRGGTKQNLQKEASRWLCAGRADNWRQGTELDKAGIVGRGEYKKDCKPCSRCLVLKPIGRY